MKGDLSFQDDEKAGSPNNVKKIYIQTIEGPVWHRVWINADSKENDQWKTELMLFYSSHTLISIIPAKSRKL